MTACLRVIRLKGSFFVNGEFHEPWCTATPSGVELAPLLSPASEQMAICHLIVEGCCWIQLRGGEAVPLDAGDVAVLPRVFRTSIRQRPSGQWLEHSIRYALGEAALDRAGSDVIGDKLAEVLFVEALRGYIEALPAQQSGWLAGMRDPLVGRSIALLYERPAGAWTVASLAEAVYSSRTVLAERFAALVGVPPMQYLTQWRMALAAHLLRAVQLSLTRIAEQVGYETDAAFSRAFRREYGMPPNTWRRRRT